MSVTIIYNSPQYCVFEFDGSSREGDRAIGGYEIMDKQLRREIFLGGQDAENFRKSVGELNALISKWNARVGKLESVTSPTTWPLQLAWATEAIDERMDELSRQEEALSARLDSATNFSPSYSSVLERVKGDIAAGRVPQADLIDSIMFVQHNDPDALTQMLESQSVPEDVKEKIRLLVGMRNEAAEADRQKREMEDQARKGRFDAAPTEEDVGGMLSPGGQELITLQDESLDELAGKKTKTPDRYYSPQGRAQQIRASLVGIRKDKAELAEVKKGLDGLREFVGRLGKGERASDVLSSTDRGEEIKRKVAEFVHKAKGFIRRYKAPVFVRNEATGSYGVNPKLLGTTGGAGNGKVAVVVNHMLSVVLNGLKAHARPEGASPDKIEDIDVSSMLEGGNYEMLPQDMP